MPTRTPGRANGHRQLAVLATWARAARRRWLWPGQRRATPARGPEDEDMAMHSHFL